MRRSVLNVLVVCVVMAAGLTFALAGEHHGKCAEGDMGCCMMVKGADVKVANIDNGVTVTVTSDQPETVKAIQEKAVECEKSCQKHGEKAGHGKEKCCSMEDVACKVAKIDNGVTITVTSDKADQVKAIQECAAKCSATCAEKKVEKPAGCPHAKAGCAATCTGQGDKAKKTE